MLLNFIAPSARIHLFLDKISETYEKACLYVPELPLKLC